MPRVYLFTIFLSALLGAIFYKIYLKSIEANKPQISHYNLLLILLILAAIYVNEKKASFENMLGRSVRRRIGTAIVVLLLILIILAVL